MINNYNSFEILGLDSRDIRVYEALFQLHTSSLRTIAETSGLNRGTVYEVIKKLTDLGLVTFKQTGQRRRFVAAPPETLRELIRDRRDKLSQLDSVAAQFADELHASKTRDANDYFAQFYEGDEGISAILRDVLLTLRTENLTEYCVFSSKDVSRFLYNNFKSFTRKRVKQGVFVRVLADTPTESELVLASRRSLPPSDAVMEGYTVIYGNKTALISLRENNVLAGIVVDDKGITNMQRLVFNSLWDSQV